MREAEILCAARAPELSTSPPLEQCHEDEAQDIHWTWTAAPIRSAANQIKYSLHVYLDIHKSEKTPISIGRMW